MMAVGHCTTMTCMHHDDVKAGYNSDFDAQFFILSDLHISPSLLLHFSCWLLVTCPFPPHQINDQQQQLKELVLLSLFRNEHILITLMKKPNQGNILNRAKSFKVPFGVWKMLLVVVLRSWGACFLSLLPNISSSSFAAISHPASSHHTHQNMLTAGRQ